jgi:hypothetical protein
MNEWILVEDRLPESDGSYLCYDEYCRQTRILVFNGFHKCWDDESGDDFYTKLIGGNVTHWMPLPPKPTT